MKTQLTKITLAAAFALAITFTLSCSNGDDDTGGNDPFSGIPEYEYLKEYFKYYDPDVEGIRCKNGVVEGVCDLPSGDVWYNPLKQVCYGVGYTCEDGNCYKGELGTFEACGRKLYVSSPNSRERCQGGVLESKCGDKWYNRETHYCSYSDETVKPMERCGSKYYVHEDYKRCEKGVVEHECGYGDNAIWYNDETHYCSSTSTVEPRRCGGVYLDNYYNERCQNGVIQNKCETADGDNINWYNNITQSCDWDTGTVKDKTKCVS